MKIADISQPKETQDVLYMPKKQTKSYALYAKASAAGQADEKTGETGMDVEEDGATVAISAEGLGLVQKDNEKDTSMQETIEKKVYQEMLEKANEAAKAQGEGFADLAKALEIARRILNGDIVPAQDEQFLMEYNSEIYMRVKSMAKVKEDPKEYDTLLEEEEEEGSGKEGGSDEERSEESAIDPE